MPVQGVRAGRLAAGIGLVPVLLAATLAVTAQPAGAQPPNPGEPPRAGATGCVTGSGEYQRADPATAGFDPAKLRAALDYAALQGSFTMKVFRHGCLVGEGLRDPLHDRVPAINYGQTKAVVALVAGIVADRGWVDLDAPIGDHLPPDLGDAQHRAVTLRQFLQLTSGVAVNHVQGLNLFADQSRSREYYSMEFEHEPGTYFEFDETTPSVVVDVLERAIAAREPDPTLHDFQAFAQRELFDPLGIPESAYFWQRDRAGTTTGYSQLWLRPLEFGRFGELLRGGGTYGGERVLSEEFARELRTGSAANCGFGLAVWLNSCEAGQPQVNTNYPSRREYPGEPWIASAPSDMYFSLGLGPHFFVIPSLDMVVTRSGEQELDAVPGTLRGDLHGAFPGNAGGPGDHEFFRLLMGSVTDLPEEVRSSIDSGPYERERNADVDVEPFVNPPGAGAGSYLGAGPQAGEGCTPLGCDGESNDGLRWIGDVPRTVPGVVGAETRPSAE